MACSWLGLLVACLLTQGAGTALADEGEAAPPPGPAPTVSFVEEGPKVLDKKSVAKAIEAGGLKVKVHNAANVAQRVSVEVVGLEGSDPEIEALFASAKKSSPVAAGATGEFLLPLGKQPLKSEKTYSLGLVASGATGGLARRGLTVDYSVPPPQENSLSPNRPIDITLSAINFLPSILSNAIGLGAFLALSLLLAAGVFWRFFLWRFCPWPSSALLAAVLIGAVTVFGITDDGWWKGPSWHAISSRPIKLAPEVPKGTLGTVSGEDGSIARLVSQDQELRPENLHGAGKLTGKYGLEGKAGKAEAGATVEVRDYWPWAVLAIALGLGIGYLLRRWFQVTRPKMAAEAALERVVEDYKVDLEILDESDAGRPYAKVTIDKWIGKRKEAVESLLVAGEAAKATEEVAAMHAYVDHFVGYRERLRRLAAACKALEEHPGLKKLKLDLEGAHGYQDALKLLEADIDSGNVDSEEELKARQAKVVAQIELIEATTRNLTKLIKHLPALEELKRRPNPPAGQAKEIADIEKEFLDAAREMLRADSVDAEQTARGKANMAAGKLDDLAGVPPTGVRFDIRGPDFDEVDQSPATAPPSAQITHSVEAAGSPTDSRVHAGDAVRFRVDLDEEARRRYRELEIDFGDGTPPRLIQVPGDGEPLRPRHRYHGHVDAATVVVKVPEGEILGRDELGEVVAAPRVLPREAKLSQSDKIVGAAAFILAVASGMSALYFGHPEWGQPADYLAAIVWGGVTGEGVKLAVALADKAWPAS